MERGPQPANPVLLTQRTDRCALCDKKLLTTHNPCRHCIQRSDVRTKDRRGYNQGMNQPYGRLYNFSAGPCTLPVEVLEEARDDLLNYKGAGMSVMEMSHRGKVFEGIMAETEASLRKLLGIPENYKVMFLQGGASLQFTMVAMNFLHGGLADYITTGTWGSKAYESGCLEGRVNQLWNGKSTNFDRVPETSELNFSPNASYIHFTSNETIQGVQYKQDPAYPGTIICDMSSDILAKKVDVSKYAMIYAGAQKNMGPAGATVVILRDDMLEKIPQSLSPMLDYRVQAENGPGTRSSRGFDARQGCDARAVCAHCLVDTVAVIRPGHVDGRDDAVAGLKSAVDMQQPIETANQKTRSNQKHQRQRYFRGNQRGPQPVL